MRHLALTILLSTASLLTSSVFAQTGDIDQVSPDLGATFNLISPGFTWQQEVHVGFSGRLTDVEVQVDGDAGATFVLRIRVGSGWTTSPPVFEQTLTLTTSGAQSVLVDVTSADLLFGQAGSFMLEMQGNATSVFGLGSHVDPGVGPAAYPHPLFLGGPVCFNDCGWRLAFRSWVDPMIGPNSYCSATPNSTGAPASLSLSGSSSVAANDMVLIADSVPNEPGIFLMGRNQADLPLGPGTLCVALPFHRLRFGLGVNQVMEFGVDLEMLPLAFQVLAGDVWNFQCYYRDPSVAPFYNLSDGLQVLFVP